MLLMAIYVLYLSVLAIEYLSDRVREICPDISGLYCLLV